MKMYDPQDIVEALWKRGMSDNDIGIAINRSRITILRIRNGKQSGVQCYEALNVLWRLSRGYIPPMDEDTD